MNADDPRYARLAVVRDMLATPDVVAAFDPDQPKDTGRAIARVGRLLLTGEGAGRVFPAKSVIATARRMNWPIALCTEAARQAQEYDLSNWAVFAASDSGRSGDVVKLFRNLRALEHKHLYCLADGRDEELAQLASKCYAMKSTPQSAAAAETKSVVEQGLFYHAMLEHACGIPLLGKRRKLLAEHIGAALAQPIDPAVTEMVGAAGTIYFAGRNDGVAEELALKANRIARKRSRFLEGMSAVEDARAVMSAGDVIVWIDPYDDVLQQLDGASTGGAAASIIMLTTRPTEFPGMVVPANDLQPFVMLAAGWNLLVEVALHLGVPFDDEPPAVTAPR